jgi:hypothetical protein
MLLFLFIYHTIYIFADMMYFMWLVTWKNKNKVHKIRHVNQYEMNVTVSHNF